MFKQSPIGRQRVLAKLAREIGTAAHYEGVRLSGSYPAAVWSRLRPQGAVIKSTDPSEQQDCITVDYVAAGGFATGIGDASGIWTIEVADHALGRMLQRSPSADPDARAVRGAPRDPARPA